MGKRIFPLLLMIAALLLPPWGPGARARETRIAFFSYNEQDTFIRSVGMAIRASAQGRAQVEIFDAANDQNEQNAQLEAQLKRGADAVIVNPVDRTTAVYLIRMALRYDTPIVLINREPLYEDLCLYEKAYYVGTNPEELGTLCGRILADYFSAHPEADKNRDGAIQYVLLKGEPGHQDAEKRTVYSVQALRDAGLRPVCLAEESAMWDRSQGQQKMAAFLSLLDGGIEGVLSNNDDMALGAIEALRAAGYFTGERFMPVVGVDATDPALEELRQGTLLGTVLNDAPGQGSAALELALLLAEGKALEAYAYPIERGKYIWIPGQIITAGP